MNVIRWTARIAIALAIMEMTPRMPAVARQSSDGIRDYFQQLDSDDPIEREKAQELLVDRIGAIQNPEERKTAVDAIKSMAAKSGDPEIISREVRVEKWLELRVRMGKLREKFDWLEKELREDGWDTAWNRLNKVTPTELTSEEWLFICRGALACLPEMTPEDKWSFIRLAAERGGDLLGPDLLRIAQNDQSEDVCDTLRRTLSNERFVSLASQSADLLDHANGTVRNLGVHLLGAYRAGNFASRVADMLKDKEVRPVAIMAIGKMKATKYAADLVKYVDDDDAIVRCAAVISLGNLGESAYAPQIVARLKDRDPTIRCKAIDALVELEAKDQIAEIVAMLDDKVAVVRASSLRAIAQMEAKKYLTSIPRHLSDTTQVFLPPLTQIWGDDAFSCGTLVQDVALHVIVALDGKECARDILGLLKSSDVGVGAKFIRTLEEIGARDAIPYVIPLLGNRSTCSVPFLRGDFTLYEETTIGDIVMDYLVTMKATEAIPEIKKHLDDPDENIRSAAQEAIESIEEE